MGWNIYLKLLAGTRKFSESFEVLLGVLLPFQLKYMNNASRMHYGSNLLS
jgi:hypothetical protein